MIKKEMGKGARIRIAILCVFIVVIYLFPIYIMFNVSLREVSDLSSRLLPTKEVIFDNYIDILQDDTFWKALINTLEYCCLDILFLIPVGSIGGYALARMNNRFSNAVRSFNVLVMMIPGTALLVGTYSMMVKLKLTNSIWGISLLTAGGSMTGCMFFYTTFATMIPTDLDEAAAIDGCSVLGTYFRIIFPQMKAVTVTRVISCITVCWNSYLMPMYLLQKSEKYTLLLFVKKLGGKSLVSSPPLMCAGAAVMVVPVLILYFSMQKFIISSRLDSAVKG